MNSFVPFTSDDEIAAIANGLLDRTLPKSVFTHAAHFAATLRLLTMRPDFDLSRDVPPTIRAFNEAVGGANTDTSGYHETITQASIRAARAFLRENPNRTSLDMQRADGLSAWQFGVAAALLVARQAVFSRSSTRLALPRHSDVAVLEAVSLLGPRFNAQKFPPQRTQLRRRILRPLPLSRIARKRKPFRSAPLSPRSNPSLAKLLIALIRE